MSHVESLLAHLPADVHAFLEDPAFQQKCHDNFCDIQKTRTGAKVGSPSGFLRGEELMEAVHRSVPENFLRERLHETNLEKLMLTFDTDKDGQISLAEFDLFCMWAVAMDVLGFFAGTSPFGQIADAVGPKNLLIISEYLDPEHILGSCALPSTLCTYYHPDGLTLDEFSAQIKAAAHVRTKNGQFFESIALANHGPDEGGLWSVCSDHPVSLRSLDSAWPRLMPMFQALASMVSDPAHQGHVDLLACNFAANPTGVECIKKIEQQTNCRFAASTDETGNVECGGNWDLEFGGRSVAPIYFHESMLSKFTKVMAPAAPRKPRPKAQGTAGRPAGDHLNEKVPEKKPPVRKKEVWKPADADFV